MRILADENFPGAAVTALQDLGHDVRWVRTDLPGAQDREVLALAAQESRILITFDKDFGELVFHLGLPASCGLVLFRLARTSPREIAKRLATVLESRTDWEGSFAVVEERRVRLRPLRSPRVGDR